MNNASYMIVIMIVIMLAIDLKQWIYNDKIAMDFNGYNDVMFIMVIIATNDGL